MPRSRRKAARVFALLLTLLFVSGGTAGFLAFRSLVTELAVSTATDIVVQSVNAIVKDVMRSGGGDGLVTLEKSADGTVSAVTTNIAAVNALAAEVLDRTVAATQDHRLSIAVPVGSLVGLRRLSIPVNVVMLSSSTSGFHSELVGAGINQTRHRILLELRIDVSLFMPWRNVGASVNTEVLVSETVVVGDVPESYLNWENKG